MYKTLQKQSLVFTVVVVVIIIAGTLLRKPTIINLGSSIQSIDVDNIYKDISKNISAKDGDNIYLKRLDLLENGEAVLNGGQPAYYVTLYPDGSIYKIIFNIAVKNDNNQYLIYQVSGGKFQKKTEDGVLISKAGKAESIGNGNASLKDVLFMTKHIPVQQIAKEVGDSKMYQFHITGIYNEGESLKTLNSSKIYHMLLNGSVSKIANEDAKNLSAPFMEIEVECSDEKGKTALTNVKILCDLNK
jgi:hypothetical protein